METHAHHLHKAPGHGWKHYLFEFLMLFLAVTLGFFVENKREYYSDERRGTQYIKSFVEDLRKDTSNFSDLIALYNKKSTVLKNIMDCYDSMQGQSHSSQCLWEAANYSMGFPDMVYTDRTLQQLKNAGGLRLLSRDDADSITAYDNLLRESEKNETTEVQEIQTLLRNIAFELINFNFVKQKLKNEDINKGNGTSPVYGKNNELSLKNIKNNKGNEIPFVYGGNNELLNKYFNVLLFYSGIVHNQIENIGTLREKATLMIRYFQDKYHLK